MGAETTNGDGFGVGWYGGRDTPGLFRSTAPRPPATLEGAVVSVNLFVCVAFGVSAVAGNVLPSTGELVDVAWLNAATAAAARAFLLGAALLLPEGARAPPPEQ